MLNQVIRTNCNWNLHQLFLCLCLPLLNIEPPLYWGICALQVLCCNIYLLYNFKQQYLYNYFISYFIYYFCVSLLSLCVMNCIWPIQFMGSDVVSKWVFEPTKLYLQFISSLPWVFLSLQVFPRTIAIPIFYICHPPCVWKYSRPLIRAIWSLVGDCCGCLWYYRNYGLLLVWQHPIYYVFIDGLINIMLLFMW